MNASRQRALSICLRALLATVVGLIIATACWIILEVVRPSTEFDAGIAKIPDLDEVSKDFSSFLNAIGPLINDSIRSNDPAAMVRFIDSIHADTLKATTIASISRSMAPTNYAYVPFGMPGIQTAYVGPPYNEGYFGLNPLESDHWGYLETHASVSGDLLPPQSAATPRYRRKPNSNPIDTGPIELSDEAKDSPQPSDEQIARDKRARETLTEKAREIDAKKVRFLDALQKSTKSIKDPEFRALALNHLLEQYSSHHQSAKAEKLASAYSAAFSEETAKESQRRGLENPITKGLWSVFLGCAAAIGVFFKPIAEIYSKAMLHRIAEKLGDPYLSRALGAKHQDVQAGFATEQSASAGRQQVRSREVGVDALEQFD